MGFCFLCDNILFGENTQLGSSSITTPHSNVPYLEKIAEVMGEEFLLIVTAADYLCKNCTSLVTHMDKLENDLKQIKTKILSFIQNKYVTPSADQPVKARNVVHGHLKTTELDIGQRKVLGGLNSTNNSVSSLKMSKFQLDNTSKIKIFKCSFCSFQSKELSIVRFHMRNHLKGEGEKPNQTATRTPVVHGHLKTTELDIGQRKVLGGLNSTNNSVSSLKMSKFQLDNTSKIKIFKCSFCSFQSKELSIVRFHMRNHLKGEGEKPNQTATRTPAPFQQQQNKQFYRCKICSGFFNSKFGCLAHIHKDHNQQTHANVLGKYVESVSTTKTFKTVKTLRSIGNHQTTSATLVNGQKQNKGLVNTGILLNDNVSTGRTLVETTNAGIEMPTKGTVQVGQNTFDSIVMEAVGDIELCCGETKQEDLDIESILAAIHNDSPSIV